MTSVEKPLTTNLLLSFNSNILLAKIDSSVTLLVLLMQEKTVFGAFFLGALIFFWGSKNFWVQFHHKIYRRHFHRILHRKYWYSILPPCSQPHFPAPLCIVLFYVISIPFDILLNITGHMLIFLHPVCAKRKLRNGNKHATVDLMKIA